MRITIAVLGIASTALWGCKEKVSSEDLVKLVAEIQKDNEGKLHPLEVEMLDLENDFKDLDSSERRNTKKVLTTAFKKAKTPMTRAEMEAANAELAKLKGYAEPDAWYRSVLDQFDTLTPEQNARMSAILRAEISFAKVVFARRKAVTDRITAIWDEFISDLVVFEVRLLNFIQLEPLEREAESKFYTELLESIYGEKTNNRAVTKKEIEEMITKTSEISKYSNGLDYVLAKYEEIPEPTLKRVKGWFKYLDRKVAEYEAKKKAAQSV